MEFSLDRARQVLSRTPAVLRALLKDLPPEWIAADEGPGTWSPFAVVGHLVHGEQTDWIPRARIILAQGSERTFEPFDRQAQFRKFADTPLGELLDTLAALRNRNLAALEGMGLTPVELELQGVHPDFGPVTLRQLLAAWVVHDLGHLAQVERVMAKQYAAEAGPWSAYLPILSR